MDIITIPSYGSLHRMQILETVRAIFESCPFLLLSSNYYLYCNKSVAGLICASIVLRELTDKISNKIKIDGSLNDSNIEVKNKDMLVLKIEA